MLFRRCGFRQTTFQVQQLLAAFPPTADLFLTFATTHNSFSWEAGLLAKLLVLPLSPASVNVAEIGVAGIGVAGIGREPLLARAGGEELLASWYFQEYNEPFILRLRPPSTDRPSTDRPCIEHPSTEHLDLRKLKCYEPTHADSSARLKSATR